MKNILPSAFRFLVCSAVVLAGAGTATARAGTIQVPAHFPSIQQAIDAAGPRDTVLVHDGTYHEGLVITRRQRGMVLRSVGGFRKTILEGTAGARIITFDEVDTLTEISGFTLRGGDPQFDGGALYAYRSTVLISNCEFTANESRGDGGALAFYDSWALLWKNTISANSARQGGGVFSNGSTLTMAGNTVRNNRARQDGGGARFIGGEVSLTGNSFIGNRADQDGGGVAFMADYGTFRSNSYLRNSARSGGGFACQGSSQPDISTDRFSGNVPGDVIGCAGRPNQR